MSPPNPVTLTDPIRETRRLKYVPSEAEVLRFLKQARTPYPCKGPGGKTNGTTHEHDPAFHDLALLIANSGLRFSEALHLEWADINLTGGHCKGGTLYVAKGQLRFNRREQVRNLHRLGQIILRPGL